jgi:hypothetical protein
MNKNESAISPGHHAKVFFTFVVLVPLVYYVPPWVLHNVTSHHFLSTVLALAIIVPIVSYVVMPGFVKAFEMANKK